MNNVFVREAICYDWLTKFFYRIKKYYYKSRACWAINRNKKYLWSKTYLNIIMFILSILLWEIKNVTHFKVRYFVRYFKSIVAYAGSLKYLKIQLDTDLKINLLGHQNNYVAQTDRSCKKFWHSSNQFEQFLHDYFDDPTK